MKKNNNLFKKILALAAGLFLIWSFAGCVKKGTESEESVDEEKTTVEESTKTKETETTTEEEISGELIYEIPYEKYDTNLFTKGPELVFAPNLEKFVYVAEKEGEKFAAVVEEKNGKFVGEEQEHYKVSEETSKTSPIEILKEAFSSFKGIEEFTFSPDSEHLAYLVELEDEYFVVLDGETGKTYPNINDDTLIFSPDSQKFAYVASTKSIFGVSTGEAFVVLNGEEQKHYSTIPSELTFSPDSQKITYCAKYKTADDEDIRVVAVNDQEINGGYSKLYCIPILRGNLDHPVFSPDSQKVAFYAKTSGSVYTAKEVVVIGEEKIILEEIDPKLVNIHEVVISPDSKHYAFVGEQFDPDEAILVLDGKVIKKVPEKNEISMIGSTIQDLQFSPDSKYFSYHLFLNEGLPEGKFNSKGGAYTTVLVDMNENEVEIDKNYQLIQNLIYSPDGKKKAYVGYKGFDLSSYKPEEVATALINALNSLEYEVVVDGEIIYQGKGGMISEESFSFSPNSKYLAFVGGLFDLEIVVNGEEVAEGSILSYSGGKPLISKYGFSEDSSSYFVYFTSGPKIYRQIIVLEETKQKVKRD